MDRLIGIVSLSTVLSLGCGLTDPLSGNSAYVPTTLRLPGGDITIATTVTSSGLMFAGVRVNGAGPFTFLIDTGANSTVISPTIGSLFPDSAVGTANTTSGAIGGTLATRIFKIDSITMGSVAFENFQATEIDLGPTTSGLGFVVDGILGLPLFRAIAMTLDFPNSSLRLRNSFLGPTDDCNILAITANASALITFPMTIAGRNTQALLDTGNNSFLLLPNSFGSLSFVGQTQMSTATTVTGTFSVLNGCLAPNSVSLGCFNFSNPCVGVGGDLVNFGTEGLSVFKVTVDQPVRRLAFEQ
jgi:predicted aspartyl protease